MVYSTSSSNLQRARSKPAATSLALLLLLLLLDHPALEEFPLPTLSTAPQATEDDDKYHYDT